MDGLDGRGPLLGRILGEDLGGDIGYVSNPNLLRPGDLGAEFAIAMKDDLTVRSRHRGAP